MTCKILCIWTPRPALKTYLIQALADRDDIEILFLDDAPQTDLSSSGSKPVVKESAADHVPADARRAWLLDQSRHAQVIVGWRPDD